MPEPWAHEHGMRTLSADILRHEHRLLAQSEHCGLSEPCTPTITQKSTACPRQYMGSNRRIIACIVRSDSSFVDDGAVHGKLSIASRLQSEDCSACGWTS